MFLLWPWKILTDIQSVTDLYGVAARGWIKMMYIDNIYKILYVNLCLVDSFTNKSYTEP